MGRAQLSHEPVPPWVVHEPYTCPNPPDETFISGGLCKLLQDIQIDLAGPEEAWHFRSANYVVTQSGAEAAAHVAVDFDPHYQRLEIHFVRVLRGKEVLDRTDMGAFDLLRRERDMERRILDGRLTASLVVPDVRPGDVVEVCLTVYGANPVLGGHYAAWVGFDSRQPILNLSHRLRHGPNRKLSLLPLNNAPSPGIAGGDMLTEIVWLAEKRPKYEFEQFAPPWVIQGAITQLSDCKDWAEVAALFTPLYPVDSIPADLQREIDALAEAHPTPAARAVEALRFVQKRLRYLALTLGEGGLVPRDIATIWSTGYGDCKDAARLYVTIAQRLGLDVCPALISTTHGPVLDKLLPSPGLFNHCIARVKVDGKSYWLDPTIRSQSGTLDVVVQPYSGWALPLAEGTTALERMNEAEPQVVVEVDEHVKFGPYVGTAAEFDRQIVYASWRADHMRDAIANQGLQNIGETWLKELQTAWPGTTEAVPMRTEDQPEVNKLTLFEKYKIATCWRAKGDNGVVIFGTHDPVIARELNLLPQTSRKTDIHLGRPRIVRRYVHLHMPRNWKIKGWDRKMEMPGLNYRSKVELKKKRLIVFSQVVAVSAETAPASYAQRYNEIVCAIREKSDVTLAALNVDGEIKRRPSPMTATRWIWIGFWALMAIGALVSSLLGH